MPLWMPKASEIPAEAFLREHQINRCALGFVAVAAVFERDAEHKLPRPPCCRLRAGVRVLRDVFVQAVHELPAAALAAVVTKQREPCGDVEEAGALDAGFGITIWPL